MNKINNQSTPLGMLSLQTLAMPKDTNPNGDVFGGWVLSQMDIASGIHARRTAKGRCSTVAISNMTFLKPVAVGSIVSCYTHLLKVGRSSMRFHVEVWCTFPEDEQPFKVTEGEFIFVAIDKNSNPRPVPKQESLG
jgi:acyl-CoA thioesterase YciA